MSTSNSNSNKNLNTSNGNKTETTCDPQQQELQNFQNQLDPQVIFVEELTPEMDRKLQKQYMTPYFIAIFKDLAMRSASFTSSQNRRSNQSSSQPSSLMQNSSQGAAQPKRKVVDKVTFQEYTNLPGVFNDQFYQLAIVGSLEEEQEEQLNQVGLSNSNSSSTQIQKCVYEDNFVQLMHSVFTSNLQTKMQLAFNMYDFAGNGFLCSDDVRLLLSHVPLKQQLVSEDDFNNQEDQQQMEMDSQSASDPSHNSRSQEGRFSEGLQLTEVKRQQIQSSINDLVDFLFETEQKMSFQEFCEINTYVSSELFISVISVLHERLPGGKYYQKQKKLFKTKQIDTYCEQLIQEGQLPDQYHVNLVQDQEQNNIAQQQQACNNIVLSGACSSKSDKNLDQDQSQQTNQDLQQNKAGAQPLSMNLQEQFALAMDLAEQYVVQPPKAIVCPHKMQIERSKMRRRSQEHLRQQQQRSAQFNADFQDQQPDISGGNIRLSQQNNQRDQHEESKEVRSQSQTFEDVPQRRSSSPIYYMAQNKIKHLNMAKKEWKDNQSDNSRSDMSNRSIHSQNAMRSGQKRSFSPISQGHQQYQQFKPQSNYQTYNERMIVGQHHNMEDLSPSQKSYLSSQHHNQNSVSQQSQRVYFNQSQSKSSYPAVMNYQSLGYQSEIRQPQFNSANNQKQQLCDLFGPDHCVQENQMQKQADNSLNNPYAENGQQQSSQHLLNQGMPGCIAPQQYPLLPGAESHMNDIGQPKQQQQQHQLRPDDQVQEMKVMLNEFKKQRDQIGFIMGGDQHQSIYGIDSFIDQQSAAASVDQAIKSLTNPYSTNGSSSQCHSQQNQLDQVIHDINASDNNKISNVKQDLQQNDDSINQYESQCFIKTKLGYFKSHYAVLDGLELYIYRRKNDCNFRTMHSLASTFLCSNQLNQQTQQNNQSQQQDQNGSSGNDSGSKPPVAELCPDTNKLLFPIKIAIPPRQARVLYFSSQQLQQKWYEKLSICMQIENINEFYEFDAERSPLLGKGQFGQVRLARHKRLKIQVAIKLTTKSKMKAIEVAQQRREIESLKICQHRDIMRLYDIFEDAAHYYMVMEYLKGPDLFSYLKERDFELDERRIKQIIYHLVQAVRYLHEKGVVHRDLKLENIMMRDNSDGATPVLVDFGLAKFIGPEQTVCEPFGTLGYAAPEVLQKHPYSFSCDVWSLGCIMYGLLCGDLPFDDDSQKETIRMTVQDPLYFDQVEWQYRSRGSRKLLEQMLVKDPSKRIDIKKLDNSPWFDDVRETYRKGCTTKTNTTTSNSNSKHTKQQQQNHLQQQSQNRNQEN